jgi:hypothetical protein
MSTALEALRQLLADGPMTARDATTRMAEAGFSTDETRTARKHLGVTKDMGGVRFERGHWRWSLPLDGCPVCQRPWGPTAPASHEPSANGEGAYDPPVPTSVPPLRDYGPPRCTVCQRASAVEPGSPCPYWRADGRRCAGVVE